MPGRGKPHHRPINVNIGFHPPPNNSHTYPQYVPPVIHPTPNVHVNYNPPSAPEPGFKWIPTTKYQCRSLEGRGVIAGYEGHDRSPIYVGRCTYGGDLLPCKIIPRHSIAYVAYDMKEIPVENFEMYCQETYVIDWVSCANGSIPPNAVQAGRTTNGEPLYIGRAHHQGSLTPGKVHPSHGCLYIPFGGQEVSIKNYEVMTHRIN